MGLGQQIMVCACRVNVIGLLPLHRQNMQLGASRVHNKFKELHQKDVFLLSMRKATEKLEIRSVGKKKLI